MEQIKTICSRDCYDVCALNFDVDEQQRIISVHGDADHPLTQGMVCPRSARDRDRLLSNRIDAPHLKGSSGFKKISWDQSLDLISQKIDLTIADYGPHGILYLSYAGNTGLLANAFPKRLWNAIGATQTDGALCSKSGHLGIGLHYGESYGANPLEIPAMELLIFWGFNAAVSAPHIWHLAHTTGKQGQAKIVVVDPIETETAKKADLWIRPKPHTDVALVYGLLNRLIAGGKQDMDFIEKWTGGFDSLEAEAAKWPPARVEQITGVPSDQLEALAALYGGNKPGMTLIGYGLQHCSNGADQVRAVALIPAVLGIHRGFFYGNGAAYHIDTARITGTSLTTHQSHIIPQVAVADHMNQGEFPLIFVSCMNPAMTLPNQLAFRKSLTRKGPFMIVHETHWTETARLADIVLPAPTFLEKEDIVIPESHNCVQYSRQIVPPVGDSRHEIQVMQDIARRLGCEEPWIYEDALTVCASALADAFEKGQVKDLMAGLRLRLRRKPMDHYDTPSGRIEFFAKTALTHGHAPLPRQQKPVVDEESFSLFTSSVSRHTHTQFQEVYGGIPAVVHINPEDAARMDLLEGTDVFLENERARLRLRVVISDALPPGIVWAPKEAADLDGLSQNCLTSSHPQTIGNGPRFNSTRVKLRGVKQQKKGSSPA
jgi:anaerobic selenocysteine-containing dehydrogenase